MKTYKKPDGSLWAFEEDGSQDHLITDDMTLLSADELAELMAPQAPTKEERIEALQVTYENDRAKLNQAWLSAMIADGIDEGTRKSLIVDQMTALDAQLETEILTIIMEE